MDLLDRYLAAVAALLPRAQREDIVAELRDILLNRLEEKEAERGRPLEASEREAVLRAFGHPIAVAGRYGASRTLIGPELYPFYIFAVKGLLILAAAVTAIPLVISILLGGEDAARGLAHFLSGFLTTAMTLIGAATMVAAGIERGWIPVGDLLDWKVADLPNLGRPARKTKTRFEAAFELGILLLFICWWTGLVAAPWALIVGQQGVFLAAAPIWTTLHLPILALAVLQAMASLVTLARPDAIRVRACLDILADLGGLALIAALWTAGRLFTVAPSGAAGSKAADIAGLQASLDLSFHLTVGVMAVVFLSKIAVAVWRLFRGVERPALVAG
ncbi:hypothetical protein EV278_11052 [Caulobacter sp. BK020]|nr:hypothetical protein EV278_11052 [Caulobacter sp. BK020]